MREFPFPTDLEGRGYRVFPSEVEKNNSVFFHGTPLKNWASIRETGFRLPDDESPLCGVSFARNSAVALSHSMTKRITVGGDYCIIAVQYHDTPNIPHVVNDGADTVHDYRLDPQPKIIGFVVIPESYMFR